MRMALLQLNPTVGDLTGNQTQIREAVRGLGESVDLVVTSELSLVGYPPQDLLLQPSFVTRCWQHCEQLAQELAGSPPVLVGLPTVNPHSPGRPLFNSAVLLHEGQIQQTFHKTLLPTYDVFDEDRYFEPASPTPLLILGQERIGVSICEDLWNDRDYWDRPRYHQDPVAAWAAAGATYLVNLSASPYSRGKQTRREAMLGKLCHKHQLPLVYVNQVGGNDDLIFDGYSCAFDRLGRLIARAPGFTPAVLIVDTVGTMAPLLPELEEVGTALVLGTRDYIRKCGFKQVLLGLSGGIDSAVTAVIAAQALGPEHVLGVLMPSPYSSAASVTDSLELAQALGIQTLTIPIQPAMNAFDQMLSGAFADYAPDVTEENIQSRLRGNILMALTNKYGAMLLTTGNKSELAVGYCTIYGDMCGGLAVIADLLKTQVYHLAHWLNRDRIVIPADILTKPPSAELRPDQTDQDALPPYALLDAVLEQHLTYHADHAELVAQGFPAPVVAQVLRWVRNAEFKRRQAPPGLRVTERAFGTGWRLPIARA
ncbi:NAD+ synthase [Candidatus Cyanaurora vandensis]|uniref:NAD+ synthase n=1 Tax=Candidatus Cyanaurora vandensis TaxID=2714958 RepID=UPI0025797742|nr:NAD+ synthase [Candidatus Cyanaurora vandensis]